METNPTVLDEKSRELPTQTVSSPPEASKAVPKIDTADVPGVYRFVTSPKITSPDGTNGRFISSPRMNAVDSSNTKSFITDGGLSEADRSGLPPGTSLAMLFRYHMGIDNDMDLVPERLALRKMIDPISTGSNKGGGRRAVNLGIYNRAIREERSSFRQFMAWRVIVDIALGLQIVFAAILTALGASGSPGDVVAIFGAMNTVLAGFLTYLKGTGLPMRMKYFYNQWLKLRAYIEQRERDFASDDHSGVHRFGYKELMEEVQIVEAMYHNIRKDIERHEPDGFKGEGQRSKGPAEGADPEELMKKGLHAVPPKVPGSSSGEGQAQTTVKTAVEEVHKVKNDIASRMQGMVETVEKKIASELNTHLAKIEHGKGHDTSTAAAGSAQAQTKDLEKGVTPHEETQALPDPEMQDISDVALMNMRQNQARALEVQHRAEARIRELEQKLSKYEAK